MGKKVVIIGGGIGGLATAIRLLHQGYKVHIVEKNSQLGGKVGGFQKEGYYFDTTATLFMLPHILHQLFESVGRDYKNYIEMVRISPNYKVFQYNSDPFVFDSELEEVVTQLESFGPEVSKGYLDFISAGYSEYKVMEKGFFEQSFSTIEELYKLKNIRRMAKLHPTKTMSEQIEHYVKDEGLKNYLRFQGMYLGISPDHGPSAYALLPVVTQIYGLWHIKGGMRGLINGLERLILELGGVIELEETVEEIIVAADKAIGVKLCDRILLADLVVCNADYPYAMENLIPNGRPEAEFQGKKANEMEYSCSAFIVYLGVGKKYEGICTHNIYLNRNFEQSVNAPFRGKIPKYPSLYFYCPTKMEPKMAPKGHEVIQVNWRVPNTLERKADWQGKVKRQLIKRTIEILEEIPELKGIGKEVQLIDCLTPSDLEQKYHSYGGAAYGLSTTLKQMAYFRPSVQCPTVDNLFFVGASVQPGPGISVVLKSAQLVVEKINESMIAENYC